MWKLLLSHNYDVRFAMPLNPSNRRLGGAEDHGLLGGLGADWPRSLTHLAVTLGKFLGNQLCHLARRAGAVLESLHHDLAGAAKAAEADG